MQLDKVKVNEILPQVDNIRSAQARLEGVVIHTPLMENLILSEGLKHYFIVRFPQRAGALRDFLEQVLGPDDDITHFEYSKKNNREKGPALVGIEIPRPENLQPLLDRMKARKFTYEYLNENSDLFQYLI